LKLRSAWVDYAKSLGIILVVYGHAARGLSNAGIESDAKLTEIINSVIYSFHMPLFFFLSGFFFYNSLIKRGGAKLVLSKVDTIVYPYLVWSIIQGISEVFLSSYTNGSLSYSEVFSLLWLPRAQFWFLYVLFIFFCVSSLVFSFFTKKVVILLFLLSIVLYAYPFDLQRESNFRLIKGYYVFFVFGIFFSIYFKIEKLSSLFSLGLLTAGFIISQYILHITLGLRYSSISYETLILSLVSILFLISLSFRISVSMPNKLLVSIGKLSMPIYILHVMASSGARIGLSRILHTDSYIIHIIVGTLVGIFIPIFVVLLANKLKFSYLFSAPINQVIVQSYNRITQRLR